MSNRSGAIQESIMRDMKEGVMTIGMDGIISFVNPAAEKILGKTADKLLGHNFAACFFLNIQKHFTVSPEKPFICNKAGCFKP